MRVGWKSPQKGTKFARHVRGSQSCPWTPKSDFLGVCVGGEFHITSTPPCPLRGVCRFPVQNDQSQFCVSRATLVPRLASPFPLSDQRAEQLLSLVELFPHCGSGTTLALQCCPGDTQGRACGAEPGSRLTFEMEAAVSLVAGGGPRILPAPFSASRLDRSLPAQWQLAFQVYHVPSCHRDLVYAIPSAWNTCPSSGLPRSLSFCLFMFGCAESSLLCRLLIVVAHGL